jgi:diguanylate cyclase (GGDEF)-like protein
MENPQPNEIKQEKPVLKININNQSVLDFEDEISSFKIYTKEPENKTEELKIEEINENVKVQEPVISEPTANSITYRGKTIDIPLSELMEVEPAFGLEPRKEFEYFLNRVLKVIRSVTSTKSAVFTLVNSDRRELIIEAFDSEVPGKIAARKRIPFGNDIVTQIVENLKPEILTDINPTAELDLIPYYLQPVGTSSFFGMPVIFNDAIVGVICVDSDENNAYDTSIVGLFGQFAKLISSLVKSYTDKYDLMQDSKTLESINKFRNMLKESDFTINKIYDSLLDSIHDNYDNCVSGIIGFNSDGNWSIQVIKNSNYPYDIEIGTIIDNNHSLAGQTLTRNRVSTSIPLRINDFRFTKKEQKINEGYFLSVPLSSLSNVYGALFLQGINSGDITQYDINILTTLATHAGSTIEQIHFTDLLKKSALFDPSTGLLNTPAFMQRLNEEVLRSSDFGYPMTLLLIEIDKYKAFDPVIHQDRHELVLMHVVDIIHGKLRPYDLFGRAESNIFGVVLIDIDTKSAKIWAEKLRSDIAISVLKINQDSFTVTVSIGVAQLGKDEAIEDVFSNAKEMLKLSQQKSNTVTLFE